MKKFTSIRITALVASMVLLGVAGSAAAAGSASLSLSPASGSHAVGSTFAVTISENSGADPVNVVEADLSYDQAHLQLAGVSCNTSAFEVNAPGGGSGVACGTSVPKTGAQAVAVATFRVIAAGSGVVNFASSSHIYRSTDNTDVWNGGTTGGSYSFPAPAPVATTAPRATAKTTTVATGTAATTTASSAATPQPVAKAAHVKAVSITKDAPVPNESNTSARWAGLGLVVILLAVIGFMRRKQLAAGAASVRSKLSNKKPTTTKAAALKTAKKPTTAKRVSAQKRAKK